MRFFRSLLCTALLLTPVTAQAEADISDLFRDGTFGGQIRYRYEYVDQNGPTPVARDAKASTARLNLNFKTGSWKGLSGFIEGQRVQHLGDDSFNSTVNGKTAYPIVADPQSTELNQAWINWQPLSGLDFKAGRQAVNHDGQRFVGSVDWRQNDQTLDAVSVSFRHKDVLQASYGYIWNVNRIFSEKHPNGDLDAKSHWLRISHQWAPWLDTAAYGYFLDFDETPALSSASLGLRATGSKDLGDGLKVRYEAEYARQRDHANNPARYTEDYKHFAAYADFRTFSFGGGYEVLGGDGSASFQTPLATLHKFNGWADKFLTTPTSGLRDGYIHASFKPTSPVKWIQKPEAALTWHDYRGDSGGADYGSETNLSLSATFALPEGAPLKSVQGLIKYADYTAEDAPYTDTKKLWLQLNFPF